MAISPEYLRLATSSARTLADTALDTLRDGVVVIDARRNHFPLILANAAARLCLTGESAAMGLVESPLHAWLGADSMSIVENALEALAADPLACRRAGSWLGVSRGVRRRWRRISGRWPRRRASIW